MGRNTKQHQATPSKFVHCVNQKEGQSQEVWSVCRLQNSFCFAASCPHSESAVTGRRRIADSQFLLCPIWLEPAGWFFKTMDLPLVDDTQKLYLKRVLETRPFCRPREPKKKKKPVLKSAKVGGPHRY